MPHYLFSWQKNPFEVKLSESRSGSPTESQIPQAQPTRTTILFLKSRRAPRISVVTLPQIFFPSLCLTFLRCGSQKIAAQVASRKGTFCRPEAF